MGLIVRCLTSWLRHSGDMGRAGALVVGGRLAVRKVNVRCRWRCHWWSGHPGRLLRGLLWLCRVKRMWLLA